MAKKKGKKKIDIRMVTRLATAGVFILSAGAVLVTGYFIMATLNTVANGGPVLSGDEVKIRRIDAKKLEQVKARLEEKTRLDAPRQGSLQNPFDISVQPLPNEEAPLPEEDAADPDASSEAQADPDAEETAPVDDATEAPTPTESTPEES